MRRTTSMELLDSALLGQEEIRSNLDHLWRFNRYLGGVSGCLRQELRGQGFEADFFVLDRRIKHLQAGHPRSDGLHPVVANALTLPFNEGSFDLVTCNLLFHHFSGNQAVAFLRGLAR